MNKIKSIIAGIFFLITGCSNLQTTDYINESPKLDLRKYLNGKVEAWGVFQDFKGKVTNRFYVVMEGSWKGNDGVLKEDFIFSDGKKQQRIWYIKYSDDNNFTATAADVIGEAKGTQNGNAVNMKYVLKLDVDGSTYNMSMDDWMFLLEGDIIVNRTTMKKFGVTVGELSLFFKKVK